MGAATSLALEEAAVVVAWLSAEAEVAATVAASSEWEEEDEVAGIESVPALSPPWVWDALDCDAVSLTAAAVVEDAAAVEEAPVVSLLSAVALLLFPASMGKILLS